MRLGLYTYDQSGKLTFSSDYSKLHYLGKMKIVGDPKRMTYDGDNSVGITSDFGSLGYTSVHTIELPSTHCYYVPFVRASANFSLLDMKKTGNILEVSVLYQNGSIPSIYIFITNYPGMSDNTQSELHIYDQTGNITYNWDNQYIKIRKVLQITDTNNLLADTSNTLRNTREISIGDVEGINDPLIHMVSQSFGSLVRSSENTWREHCKRVFGMSRKRSCATATFEFIIYRNSIRIGDNSSVISNFIGQLGGRVQQTICSKCGYSGIFGSLLTSVGSLVNSAILLNGLGTYFKDLGVHTPSVPAITTSGFVNNRYYPQYVLVIDGKDYNL